MSDYGRELAAAKEIAREAGAIMRKYFDSDMEVRRKTDGSPVTAADKKINRLVIDHIGSRFKDGIVGEEESTAQYGMGRRWICDPIDGTKGFIWGVPTAMFSLGLVVDGLSVLGVAYDPFLDRLYEATSGGGSFCSGKPIRVSDRALEGAPIGISSGIERMLSDTAHMSILSGLRKNGAKLACIGGAVFKACLVARGKLAGYIEPGLNPHDLAAADIIVREAGGKVTDMRGEPLDYSRVFHGAIISNGACHAEILASISQ